MENMMITTTPILDGHRITQYVGPVVVPIVGAANMIKDWFAGFTDVFGGNSCGYQKVFAKFIHNGVKEMMSQAKVRGTRDGLRFLPDSGNSGRFMYAKVRRDRQTGSSGCT